MQHLKSLKFCSEDLSRRSLVLLFRESKSTITQTIQQTGRLESLSISFGADVEFSADQVRVWLLHTRDSLRELNLYHKIVPSLNVVEDFRGNKLEELKLLHVSLVGVELGNKTLFPCLKILRLESVKLSAFHLCSLLALCPKIEDLSLLRMDLGPNPTLEWSTTTLKWLHIAAFYVEKFVLEAGNLESLELERSDFDLFKLVGNTSLKLLDVDASDFDCFDLGGNMKNLEQVNVRRSEIEGFYDMISESSNLTRLHIWVVLTDGYYIEFTDMDKISVSFPNLTNFSIYFNWDEAHLNLQGSTPLQNLVELEIGIASYLNFSDKVGRVLEFCPNLKKVVIRLITESMTEQFSANLGRVLPEYSSDICHLSRKYLQVEFDFADDEY